MTQARGAALVTGGGKRIGKAISLRLAREGYALALHASERSRADAENVKAEIEAGGRARVRSRRRPFVAGYRICRCRRRRNWARLTALVNNASLFERDGAARSMRRCSTGTWP